MTKKRRDVQIKILIECECGHKEEVADFGDAMRVHPGYTNDSGTHWPGEIKLRCRVCGGLDATRTC